MWYNRLLDFTAVNNGVNHLLTRNKVDYKKSKIEISTFISIAYIINSKAGLPPLGFIYFVARNAILIAFGLGIGIDFFLQNQRKLFILLKIKTE